MKQSIDPKHFSLRPDRRCGKEAELVARLPSVSCLEKHQGFVFDIRLLKPFECLAALYESRFGPAVKR